jgi:outer membrane murein-binding lipoprotein Lpp
MTTSDAEKYGRRAQAAGDVAEVGSAVKHAVDELVRAIRDLEARISRLESKMSDDQLGAPH